MLKKLVFALAFAAALGTGPVHAAIDPNLPVYTPVSGVDGTLSSVGSDTLANLMTLWAEEFKRVYPNVNIQIQAAGSSTAPPALTEGTSNIGPMSRKMKDGEIQKFEETYGYPPFEVPVAIDALAVYVHRDNPIEGLTFPQVDAIFSSTRKCEYPTDISRWGQLGLAGPLASADIQLFGRNSVSGTYGYFKEKALCKGDFKSNVNEQPGSASVVQSVGTSPNAIGYSGIGYRTAAVRSVPLAKNPGDAFVDATNENALNGTYPLARFLYVYVNRKPDGTVDPVVAEFIRMVLSRKGQEIVEKDGYVPLPARVADRILGQL